MVVLLLIADPFIDLHTTRCCLAGVTKSTLLHFIAQMMETQYPDIMTFTAELAAVEAAAKVDQVPQWTAFSRL